MKNNDFIKIEVIPTGMLNVNCSLISNENSREIFLVDPGGDEDLIFEYIKKNSLILKSILHTHSHFDHIMGTSALIEKHFKNDEIPIYLHPEDQYLWDNMSSAGQLFGFEIPPQKAKVNNSLKDNEILDICGIQIKVLHTPGHSPGSCSFSLDVDQGVLIVGDVIFQNSIGRTDLWKGDYETLMKSIHERILIYPDETRIISGHGPDTTVGEEKKFNPFLADDTEHL